MNTIHVDGKPFIVSQPLTKELKKDALEARFFLGFSLYGAVERRKRPDLGP